MAETQTDEDDPSDLDITKIVRRDLKKSASALADALGEGDPSHLHHGNQGNAKRLPHSDFDDNESLEDEGLDEAYLAFKNRKSRKRKRAPATSSRQVKQQDGRSYFSAKGKQSANVVVGKRQAPKKRKRAVWTDVRDDSDDAVDENQASENLPEHLKSRKRKFDRVYEHLGTAGLKLPPRYDEVEFSDDERLAELVEKPNLPDLRPCAPYSDSILEYSGGILPAPTAQWLREYQVKGAQFLHELFVWQRGGILGDDMGLGKTIQVISFLTAAFGKTGDERDNKRMRKMRRLNKIWYPRVLLVCPGTLIKNWEAELDRWGWWHHYVYHGSTTEKEEALQAAQNGRLEIMLTTYETYRRSKDKINAIEWDCVVADECHCLKNRSAEITRAMYDVNALCRIGLTGTAIQNNYDELWTILNWTNPGKFGSLSSWQRSISNPLKRGQAHDATSHELGMARRTAYKLVNNLLPQFFLRRMKSLIADQLPKKRDRVVFCPLTETQQDAYMNYCSSEIAEAIRTATDPCDCESSLKKGWCCRSHLDNGRSWREYVFPLIHIFQKISNHIALLIPSNADTPDTTSKYLEHLQTALPDQWEHLYETRDSILNFRNQEFCGKWKILKRLLEHWAANGDKVLIFSHSVRLLKMLDILFSTTTAFNVSYLDGSMTYEDRQICVDEFNSNPKQFVFLISTKAGGVGLNITSANKVVVFDPHWNPSYDLQAQDRAYRIGQLRDVEVFRLVSAGTIEEITYARQIYKQQQANIGYTASNERRYFMGVQNDAQKKGEIFGLANLFSFRGEGVVLQDIVNKTNVAESRIGIAVAGIDMSQVEESSDDLPGGESSAMKNLDALIGEADTSQANDSKSKVNAVEAILANAGVDYMHDNAEVIGSSKTEERISRKAAENMTGIDVRTNRPVFEQTMAGHDKEGSSAKYRYHPPEDVLKRQFVTMSRMFGFESVTDFALVVESWTQEQRRNSLDKFYTLRRQRLSGSEHATTIQGEGTAISVQSTASRSISTAESTSDEANFEANEKDEGETTDDEL